MILIGIEHHTQRQAKQFPPPTSSGNTVSHTKVLKLDMDPNKDMPVECFMMCNDTCKSWTFDEISGNCELHFDAPRMNGHNETQSSGVKVG